MGCLRGSKFTCILSLGPAYAKRVPVNLPTWHDVRERLFDERSEISHGDSPKQRLRRVIVETEPGAALLSALTNDH